MKARVFALTWLSYASYYVARKPFGIAKKSMQSQEGLSTTTLAHIDTAYLAAYAGGQFVWGLVSDRAGSRRVIAAGMLLSAGCAAAFGLSSLLVLFALVWAMNGFFQASGWSPNVKAMTAHFPPEGRGTLMGFWTTNYVVGGLVAGPIAAYFMSRGGGNWRSAFFGPAVIVACVALVIFLFLPDSTRRTKKQEPVPVDHVARRAARARVLRTPLLWSLGSAYFFMKLARYMLLAWLVFYMEKQLHYSNSTAVYTAMAFEVGGAVAAVTIGWISERFGARRIPIGVISLLCLAAALPFYGYASTLGVGWNLFSLALVGFFLFGPDALLSATAAQDLGGPLAAATAAGIINGMGSIGPIFGSESFVRVAEAYSWQAAWSVLGVGALISALILMPFLRRA